MLTNPKPHPFYSHEYMDIKHHGYTYAPVKSTVSKEGVVVFSGTLHHSTWRISHRLVKVPLREQRLFSFSYALSNIKTAEDSAAPGAMTSSYSILTHLLLDKMAAMSQTIFSDVYSWLESFVFWLKFHWSLFMRVQFTITQHWFR